MSSAPSSAIPEKRYRTLRIAYTAGLLLVILVFLFIWINPYLEAASVLTLVGDPKSDGVLAHFGTNSIQTYPYSFQGPSGEVPSKLYVPEGVSNPPAMVVLHGVHHLGIEEPRLKNFARALASHGVLVATPEMADLADYHVEPQSIDVIGLCAQDLKKRTGAQKVSVLGLSFAGGLALVAASDRRYENDISIVASIGGYDDLARVLRYYATNTIEQPDGTRWTVPAHEYGILVVAYSHPEEFFSPQDVAVAREALRQQLYENVVEAKRLAEQLSPPGRQRMELLLAHKTEVLSSDLLQALGRHESETEFVSPTGKMAHIKADVFLAHGAGDNVIPPCETEWLARETPPTRLKAVLISPVISHVELGKRATFTDELRLVNFMEEFLHDSANKARTSHALNPGPKTLQAPATR